MAPRRETRSTAEASAASEGPQGGEAGVLAQILAEVKAVSGRVAQLEARNDKGKGPANPSPPGGGDSPREPESPRGQR